MRAFASPQLGEFGRLEANGCGFTLTPGDGEALTERIRALANDRHLSASMGARARMAFERECDKQQALAKWEAMLRAVGRKAALGQPFRRMIGRS